MKFVCIALALFSLLPHFFSFLSKNRKNADPLPSSTPKAQQLHDHFGVAKGHNMYGPPPSLNLENLLIRNQDLSWTKIPSPAFANELITPDGKKCDITKHAYYDICKAAMTCSECSAIESCGWCHNTSKCLPGNIDGCFCKDDCPTKWYLSDLQCPSDGKVVLGQMTNISPYATKMVSPELTGPKLNITTTQIQPGWDSKRMILGTSVTRKNVTAFNAAENRIVEGEVNLQENIIRDVPIPSLKINSETKTYNLLTGKELPVNSTIGFHGINTLKK